MKNKSQSPSRGSSAGRQSVRNRQNCNDTLADLLRTRTTAADFEPIKRKLVAGLSVPEILREEAHKRQLVARKDQQPGLGYSIDELAKLKSEVMDITMRALRKKADGASALQVCRLLRRVPTRGELAARRTADPAQQLEAYRRLAGTQLGFIALERNRVYGTELPIPQEELDERVRKVMAEESARKAQNRNSPHSQSATRTCAGDRHNTDSKLSRPTPSTTVADFEPIRRKLIDGMPIAEIVRGEERERRAAEARQPDSGYSADDLADLKTEVLHLAVSELRDKQDLQSALQVWHLLQMVPTPAEVAALSSTDPAQAVDPYTMCAATQLGVIAWERGGANGNDLPVPQEEIEKRAGKSMQEQKARAARR